MSIDDKCDGPRIIKIIHGEEMDDKAYQRYKTRVLSEPLPGTFMEDMKFYFSKNFMKLKYKSVMFSLEDNIPTLYKILTSCGFPSPYTSFPPWNDNDI